MQTGYEADLRTQLDTLREENRQLRGLLGDGFQAPGCLHLAAIPERLLGLLLRRPFASFEAIETVLWGEASADRSRGTIAVHVCRLRQRLKPYGVEIVNHWGTGFEIPPASKVRFRTFFEAEA